MSSFFQPVTGPPACRLCIQIYAAREPGAPAPPPAQQPSRASFMHPFLMGQGSVPGPSERTLGFEWAEGDNFGGGPHMAQTPLCPPKCGYWVFPPPCPSLQAEEGFPRGHLFRIPRKLGP